MGPANLAPIHRPEVERLGPIAHQDPSESAIERLKRLLAVVREDLEHRRRLRRDGPERAHSPGVQPAGAVGVLHRAFAHVLPRLVDDGLDRVAHARFDRAERAERDANAEQLPEQDARLAAAHVVDAREERDQRHQTWSEGRRGDLRRVVRRARLAPALRAPDLVKAPLLRVRLDRRQLDVLVPTRAGIGDLGKLVRAALAVRRENVDHLVDLLGRKKVTT